MNIFITSTGANTGKTVIGSGIAGVMQSLGYETGIYKPIQTGCKFANNKQFSPDLNFVKKVDPNIKTYSTYNFKMQATPAIAANHERTNITIDNIANDYALLKRENDIVLVEGTGNLLTPLSPKLTMGDIAVSLQLPLLVVINTDGDFVNQALMTFQSIQNCNLPVIGVIFNNYSPKSINNIHHNDVQLLEQMTEYNILGYIPTLPIEKKSINPETLISEVIKNVDLAKTFNMEIPKLSF